MKTAVRRNTASPRSIAPAIEDIVGPTAVHICFGYATIIHEQPSGYSFLTQLSACTCNQVSLETAQSQRGATPCKVVEVEHDNLGICICGMLRLVSNNTCRS